MLVAVSIPIFTSQLEKSREATDTANLRVAKAAATVLLLDGTDESGVAYDYTTAKTLSFTQIQEFLLQKELMQILVEKARRHQEIKQEQYYLQMVQIHIFLKNVSQNYIQVVIESDAATPVQVKFVDSAS